MRQCSLPFAYGESLCLLSCWTGNWFAQLLHLYFYTQMVFQNNETSEREVEKSSRSECCHSPCDAS